MEVKRRERELAGAERGARMGGRETGIDGCMGMGPPAVAAQAHDEGGRETLKR